MVILECIEYTKIVHCFILRSDMWYVKIWNVDFQRYLTSCPTKSNPTTNRENSRCNWRKVSMFPWMSLIGLTNLGFEKIIFDPMNDGCSRLNSSFTSIYILRMSLGLYIFPSKSKACFIFVIFSMSKFSGMTTLNLSEKSNHWRISKKKKKKDWHESFEMTW